MFGKFFLWLFAIQLAASASPPTNLPKGPPPPKLVREIALLPPSYAIGTLAFSPDEQWIAITAIAQHRPGSRQHDEDLLLVPVGESSERIVRLDPGPPIGWGPVWSPDSKALLVGEFASATQGVAKLFNLRGDQIWARDVTQPPSAFPFPPDRPAGEVFGFLSSDRLIAELLEKHQPASFAALDLHGQVTDSWRVPKKWTIAAASPERRLLAVYSGDDRSKTLIIDYSSRKVIQSKRNPTWLYRHGVNSAVNAEFFTEGGKTLCVVGGLPDDERPAECWDVDTGKTVGEFRRFYGGAPAAGSTHSSRLILTQVRTSFRQDIDYYSDGVVWDFRAGAEVAAWPAPGQLFRASGIVQPAAVALSATGRYAADGAAGILRVYELP